VNQQIIFNSKYLACINNCIADYLRGVQIWTYFGFWSK